MGFSNSFFLLQKKKCSFDGVISSLTNGYNVKYLEYTLTSKFSKIVIAGSSLRSLNSSAKKFLDEFITLGVSYNN